MCVCVCVCGRGGGGGGCRCSFASLLSSSCRGSRLTCSGRTREIHGALEISVQMMVHFGLRAVLHNVVVVTLRSLLFILWY